MRATATLLLVSSLALPLAGCKQEAPATRAKTSASTPAPAAKNGPAASAAVARIVFVDKEEACDCTRDRIDKSWKALTDVVGTPPVPKVERIHMDSQPDKAAPYKKLRPIMVPPAIYFLDKQDKLVQVHQGEVKREQIRATLKK